MSPAPLGNCELYAVELLTPDWERLVAWYRRALGLRVAARVVEDRYALLLAGQTCIAIRESAAAPQPSLNVRLIFEVADLAAAAARLAEQQTLHDAPRRHGEGFWELKTTDPDGNLVRLFSWASEKQWERPL